MVEIDFYGLLVKTIVSILWIVAPFLAVAFGLLVLWVVFFAPPRPSRRRLPPQASRKVRSLFVKIFIAFAFIYAFVPSLRDLSLFPIILVALIILFAAIGRASESPPHRRSSRPPLWISRGVELEVDDGARHLGDIGEKLTREVLKRLDPNAYAVLPDPAVSRRLILPDGRGGTAELDLVVFSRFGIFALEVKHWSGFVFGKKNDRTWTVTYLGGKKFKDSNPLRQNSGKVKALQKITDLPARAFYSVAVLSSDECEFKNPDRPENVVYLNELTNHILSKREAIMSDEEVSDAIVKVVTAADKAPDAMERHVESLRIR